MIVLFIQKKSSKRVTHSADPPKIAISMSKNCPKLDIFSKKMPLAILLKKRQFLSIFKTSGPVAALAANIPF